MTYEPGDKIAFVDDGELVWGTVVSDCEVMLYNGYGRRDATEIWAKWEGEGYDRLGYIFINRVHSHIKFKSVGKESSTIFEKRKIKFSSNVTPIP